MGPKVIDGSFVKIMLEIRDEARPDVVVWQNQRDAENRPYLVEFTLG